MKEQLVTWSFPILMSLCCLYLWWLERKPISDNKLNMVDFITGPQGHGDKYSLAFIAALIVSTWGMWVLVLLDKLSEWYFSAYIGGFVLGSAFKTGAQVYAAGKQVDAAAQVPGTVVASNTSDTQTTSITPAPDQPHVVAIVAPEVMPPVPKRRKRPKRRK